MVSILVGVIASVGCGRVHFAEVDGDAEVDDDGAADSYAATVLADGPASYWRLGEASGTTARDEVGGRAGAYVGTCQLGVAGAVRDNDTAVRFDGSTCYIDLGDIFPLAGGVPFAIELWASPTIASTTTRFLVSRNTPSGVSNGYQLCFQSTFSFFERLYDDASAGYLGIGPLALDTFQLITVTYDGTMQRFYINGGEVASNNVGPGPLAAGRLLFGDNARNVFFKFEGVLDEIAFFEHALAADRVAAHYAAR